MEKATEAREKDKQGIELEAIKLAVVNSIASDLTGLVNVDALKQGLTGLVKGNLDTIIDSTKTEWEVEGNTGRLYKITNTGNVEIASTVNITKDDEIVTEFSYNSSEIELNTTTIQLNATPTPDLTVNSVTWESGTPSVASIDNTGLVTLKDKGSTIITLTANTTGGNFTKTCTITIVKPLEIGDSVPYSTTINNQTLSNWKVLYKETIGTTKYTWIILDDYLPNNCISDTLITNNNLQIGNGAYCIKATTNRADLLNAITTTENWAELVNNGSINGTALITSDTNVKAIGSPTLELWTNSWNTTYPYDKIYTSQTTDAMNDGLFGNYIDFVENSTTYGISLKEKEGWSNALYFPYKMKEDECYGYWISSPSAQRADDCGVCTIEVNKSGKSSYSASLSGNGSGNRNMAFRPVICLPSSIFE